MGRGGVGAGGEEGAKSGDWRERGGMSITVQEGGGIRERVGTGVQGCAVPFWAEGQRRGHAKSSQQREERGEEGGKEEEGRRLEDRSAALPRRGGAVASCPD